MVKVRILEAPVVGVPCLLRSDRPKRRRGSLRASVCRTEAIFRDVSSFVLTAWSSWSVPWRSAAS